MGVMTPPGEFRENSQSVKCCSLADINSGFVSLKWINLEIGVNLCNYLQLTGHIDCVCSKVFKDEVGLINSGENKLFVRFT